MVSIQLDERQQALREEIALVKEEMRPLQEKLNLLEHKLRALAEYMRLEADGLERADVASETATHKRRRRRSVMINGESASWQQIADKHDLEVDGDNAHRVVMRYRPAIHDSIPHDCKYRRPGRNSASGGARSAVSRPSSSPQSI